MLDRDKAEAEFLAGTISEKDKRELYNMTGATHWSSLLQKKWALDHKALIDEARASNDLACRMLVALAEKP